MPDVAWLTHRGWFGICPVYLGEVRSPYPLVVERHAILAPLLWSSIALYDLCMLFCERLGCEVPGYPLVVGKRLRQPREHRFE